MLTATPFYLAAAVALYSYLSFQVIGLRVKDRILIGDNDDPEMKWRIRGHANFAEYTPLALLSLGLAELAGTPSLVLHICGVALIVGRLLHANYFFRRHKALQQRINGMRLTFASMWISAAAAAGWTVYGMI